MGDLSHFSKMDMRFWQRAVFRSGARSVADERTDPVKFLADHDLPLENCDFSAHFSAEISPIISLKDEFSIGVADPIYLSGRMLRPTARPPCAALHLLRLAANPGALPIPNRQRRKPKGHGDVPTQALSCLRAVRSGDRS